MCLRLESLWPWADGGFWLIPSSITGQTVYAVCLDDSFLFPSSLLYYITANPHDHSNSGTNSVKAIEAYTGYHHKQKKHSEIFSNGQIYYTKIRYITKTLFINCLATPVGCIILLGTIQLHTSGDFSTLADVFLNKAQ